MTLYASTLQPILGAFVSQALFYLVLYKCFCMDQTSVTFQIKIIILFLIDTSSKQAKKGLGLEPFSQLRHTVLVRVMSTLNIDEHSSQSFDWSD